MLDPARGCLGVRSQSPAEWSYIRVGRLGGGTDTARVTPALQGATPVRLDRDHLVPVTLADLGWIVHVRDVGPSGPVQIPHGHPSHGCLVLRIRESEDRAVAELHHRHTAYVRPADTSPSPDDDLFAGLR